MDTIKEMIEKELGFEIDKYEVNPIYSEGKYIGLNVVVQPKSGVETLITNITFWSNTSEDI